MLVAGGCWPAAARRRRSPAGWRRVLGETAADVRAGALARGAWPLLLGLSAAALAGYLLLFLSPPGRPGPPPPSLALLPPLLLALMAMGLPISIGGWGPREGVAAFAFWMAGLGAPLGVTTSVAYGALALIASLPGGVVLLARRFAGSRRPAEQVAVVSRSMLARRTRRPARAAGPPSAPGTGSRRTGRRGPPHARSPARPRAAGRWARGSRSGTASPAERRRHPGAPGIVEARTCRPARRLGSSRHTSPDGSRPRTTLCAGHLSCVRAASHGSNVGSGSPGAGGTYVRATARTSPPTARAQELVFERPGWAANRTEPEFAPPPQTSPPTPPTTTALELEFERPGRPADRTEPEFEPHPRNGPPTPPTARAPELVFEHPG